jgi:hypothetical protein
LAKLVTTLPKEPFYEVGSRFYRSNQTNKKTNRKQIPILNELLECTWMVNTHTYILASSNTPTKWSSWSAFNWLIDVGSYYKLKQLDKENASYVYNLDKILSQFDKFYTCPCLVHVGGYLENIYLWKVHSQFEFQKKE